jgi:hypothetical protein
VVVVHLCWVILSDSGRHLKALCCTVGTCHSSKHATDTLCQCLRAYLQRRSKSRQGQSMHAGFKHSPRAHIDLRPNPDM